MTVFENFRGTPPRQVFAIVGHLALKRVQGIQCWLEVLVCKGFSLINDIIHKIKHKFLLGFVLLSVTRYLIFFYRC